MDEQKMREDVSDILVKTESIKVNLEKPFRFVSGIMSPVYVDCRRLISFVDERNRVVGYAADLVKEKVGLDGIDVIAGGETAGIPYAAFLAQKLDLPMAYVRKKPKGHGAGQMIEGVLEGGQRVLLFEDLITDGGSKVNFLNGIRDAGAECSNCLVVFEYGKKGCRELLKENGAELYSMTSWSFLLDYAVSKGYFTDEEKTEVESFLSDPDNWAKKRGIE